MPLLPPGKLRVCWQAGKWASGGYVISTPITDPEMLENLAEEQAKERPEDREESSHKH